MSSTHSSSSSNVAPSPAVDAAHEENISSAVADSPADPDAHFSISPALHSDESSVYDGEGMADDTLALQMENLSFPPHLPPPSPISPSAPMSPLSDTPGSSFKRLLESLSIIKHAFSSAEASGSRVIPKDVAKRAG